MAIRAQGVGINTSVYCMLEASTRTPTWPRPAVGRGAWTWVFPSPTDVSQPCSRHLVRDWWERLAARAGIPVGQRFGWHTLRRKFASELKATPLRDLAHLGGWKSAQTILTCYMAPDEATQRAALAQRKSLCAGGLS